MKKFVLIITTVIILTGCNTNDDSKSDDLPECGIINGENISCDQEQICATVEWVSSTQEARCYPEDICENSMCGAEAECVIMESYPSQVKCVTNDSEPLDAFESISITNEIKECPDEWIMNRMPIVIGEGERAPANQYFIVNGERRETSEYDMQWVNENCNLQPQEAF